MPSGKREREREIRCIISATRTTTQTPDTYYTRAKAQTRHRHGRRHTYTHKHTNALKHTRKHTRKHARKHANTQIWLCAEESCNNAAMWKHVRHRRQSTMQTIPH